MNNMNKLLFGFLSVSLLGSSSVQAQSWRDDCISSRNERVCVGNTVINTSNQIGEVKEVFRNGKVKVQLKGYYSINTYDVDTLAVSVRCSSDRAICEDDKFMNQSNQTGVTKLVFSNDKAQVQLDGYYSLNIFSTDPMSAEVDYVSGFEKNDRFMNSSNQRGKILSLYANGKVVTQLDGYYSKNTYDSKTLGKGVQKLGIFTVGERVINRSNQTGKIVELFDHEKAVVQLDGYYSTNVYSLDELSDTSGGRYNRPPHGGGRNDDRNQNDRRDRDDRRYSEILEAGDKVMNKSNQVGTVKEVFRSGQVKVQLDGYYGLSTYDQSELTKEISCYEDFCKNDRAINSSNQAGKISMVFSNGKMKVQLDGYYGLNTYDSKELGRSVTRYRGFAVNQRVINRSNQTGKIIELFTNGKAKVQLDGYYGLNTYSLHEISQGSN